MINLDNKGFLTPNELIISTLSDFKHYFVDNIESKTRVEIYANYINYSNKLKDLLQIREIKQWINGSFVCSANNPKDIDFVSFIDYKKIETYREEVKLFTSNQEWLKSGIDAYLISVYPRNHKLFTFYESDKCYWIDKFDKTRRNSRTGLKSPKGFLEIIF